MERKRVSKKNILILMVFTTTTVFCWIGFEVYRAWQESFIPQILKEQLESLEPKFNKETLKSLEERKSFKQEDLDSLPEINELELEEEPASPGGAIANE